MVKTTSGVNLKGLQMTRAARAAIDKAEELGMYITSAYRSPEHNREVGGSKTSDHLEGRALDLDGGYAANDAFAEWAEESGLFDYVLWQEPGHYDHVHVSWEVSGHEYRDASGNSVGIWEKGGIVGVIQDLVGAVKDNFFGPKTEQAVKEFQRSRKIEDDGIVGPITWDELTEGWGRFFYQ